MLSKKYKHWISCNDPKRCKDCEDMHGKIYGIAEVPKPKPPLHPFCRCVIKIMEALKAGTATYKKLDGADFWLKYIGYLPEYYISSYAANMFGWAPSKWPSNFVPDKTITMGEYKNFNGHLPMRYGRIWYEADINYKTGRRNSERILWSNDGLIFVTYDHYKTFYEIV